MNQDKPTTTVNTVNTPHRTQSVTTVWYVAVISGRAAPPKSCLSTHERREREGGREREGERGGIEGRDRGERERGGIKEGREEREGGYSQLVAQSMHLSCISVSFQHFMQRHVSNISVS